ncbi:MAG: cytochrome c, partial [Cyanobacteria bacterium REEB65]|nr:cytochrome c [Cyanobacteria bacterium REEB65]
LVASLAVIAFKDLPTLSPARAAWIALPVLVALGCVVAFRSVAGPEASQAEAPAAPAAATASTAVTAAAAPAASAAVEPATDASAAAHVATAAAASAPDGKALFAANCAACHQSTGLGVPGTFPPLAGSEVPNGPAARHIHFVLDGHSGPLTVQGKPFNGTMPPFKGQLSAPQIAAIITYERSAWGNHGGPVSAAQVQAQLKG